MASVEESIRDRLGTDSALEALVGDRIYPDTIPDYDAPRPWVVFTATETAPTDELSADAVEVSVIEFDCIADSKAEVKAVALALRSRLHKYRGGQVGRALWIGDQAEDLDGAYLITVRFRVRSSTATIIPADSDNNARIVTGEGRIDLFPNGSGISVWVSADGVIHGDGSGLTGVEAGDPAGTAATLVAAHEAASDPHPQYTTAAELSTALAGYSVIGHTHSGYATTGANTFSGDQSVSGNLTMSGGVLTLQSAGYSMYLQQSGTTFYFSNYSGPGSHTRFYNNNAENLRLDASGHSTFLGGICPVSMTDAAAPNNSVYYSTTANKLVYKDSGGSVNNLY